MKFQGATYNNVRSLMGTVVDPEWAIRLHEKKSFTGAEVPENFDSRTEWPKCESRINHIRD